MALGGGNFLVQNKVIPGSYINFVSTSNGSAVFADRGVGAIAMELDWGLDDKVFQVTNEDFQKNSQEIFGYAYTDPKMMGIRDFFKNGKTLLAFKLNGGGTRASNTYAEAKYKGIRGNDIAVRILANADNEGMFDVYTSFDGTDVDCQTVEAWTELTDNSYVKWKSDVELADVESTPLTGGTNGTVTGQSVQLFLQRVESYTFNTIAIDSGNTEYSDLIIAFTKRMRDECGVKFQAVIFTGSSKDYEGVIYVENSFSLIPDDFKDISQQHKGIYWVSGAVAGCPVNKSLTNKKYDGEYYISANYTQDALSKRINYAGSFIFHRVGDDIRVLLDINTLLTFSDEKGEVFRDNQTIRVCDQIATDIAAIFNNYYLGQVPNDKAGRISLKNDIVKHHKKLLGIRAIEDFDEDDITVEQGETKNSVVVYDAITPVNAMAKLYMTVTVN